MVIKVNEDRRSDVIARRDAWQKDYDAKKLAYDKQYFDYDTAREAVSDTLVQEIKKQIGNVPKSEYLNIYAEPRWGGYEVHIEYAQRAVHNEDKALSWDFRIILDRNGTLKKESGSWSGLQATTSEQIKDLKETVRILEVINNMDWETLINNTVNKMPKRDEYITAPNPDSEAKPDWKTELIQASIEDAIGQNILIKGRGEKGGTVYYKIIRQTPKRYEVASIPGYYIRDVQNGNSQFDSIADVVANYGRYTYGISKDKLAGLVNDWSSDDVETIEY